MMTTPLRARRRTRRSSGFPLLSCALAGTFAVALLACGDDAEAPAGQADIDTGIEADAGTDTVEDVDMGPEPALASCVYTNPFGGAEECKTYTGTAWTAESATEDCETPFPGADTGVFTLDFACDLSPIIGECIIEGEEGVLLQFAGSEESACAGAVLGCETFGGGTFIPEPVCGGTGPGPGPITSGVFLQPFTECVNVPEGEGSTADGEVCTRVAISGCTEPGESFADTGACETVLTQRPYYPLPAEYDEDPNDPRLADAAYMAESDWAREQIATCGCVCCHSTEVAPEGPSFWYIDPPLWIDTLSDSGLALFAGYADSSSLGAYPAADNSGFDREALGIPTNDVDRMRAFLENEMSRRGITPEEASSITPFGGPIYDQLVFAPEACANEEGVSADGTVTWRGGDARYVYVLENGAGNPGVPPNLDTPTGTVWRLDVQATGTPVASGVAYGATRDGSDQRVPESGDAPALVDGETYYLYVLLDVGVPVTRCLFEYGGA
jgi:hypothetical protein